MTKQELKNIKIGDVVQLINSNKANKTTNLIPCKVVGNLKDCEQFLIIEACEGYEFDADSYATIREKNRGMIIPSNQQIYDYRSLKILEKKKSVKVKVKKV